MNEINILSDQFLNLIKEDISKQVNKTLKSIEKNYAVKSRYLNKKNACVYADIAPATLDRWIAKGLPITKIDGCFRIDVQEIDKFMIENRV